MGAFKGSCDRQHSLRCKAHPSTGSLRAVRASQRATVVAGAQKREMMMWEALREGLDEEMERDPTVCLMGAHAGRRWERNCSAASSPACNPACGAPAGACVHPRKPIWLPHAHRASLPRPRRGAALAAPLAPALLSPHSPPLPRPCPPAGEDVGHYGGSYKVSSGLYKKYGEMRLLDTPICENGFMGMGVGAAMTGLRPIVEGMNMGFLLLAFNQISNNCGMLHYTSGGQYKVGGRRGPGPALGGGNKAVARRRCTGACAMQRARCLPTLHQTCPPTHATPAARPPGRRCPW